MDRTKWSNEQLTRTMVTTLVFSNVILSLVNRSFYYSVFASLKNKNNMMVIANSLNFLANCIHKSDCPFLWCSSITARSNCDLHCRECCFGTLVEIWKWNKRKNNTQPNEI
jgi:Ca2+-transporting ATPase